MNSSLFFPANIVFSIFRIKEMLSFVIKYLVKVKELFKILIIKKITQFSLKKIFISVHGSLIYGDVMATTEDGMERRRRSS